MNMPGAIFELTKLVFAAILGFSAKVFYDRRFARRPDVSFSFEQPATFGVGDKARTYQNLEITNIGRETATDVRILFRRPMFDLVDHQIQFTGAYSIDREDERSIIAIPTLPPSDRALLSFIFSPEKCQIQSIQELLISVRASNCLGRPRPTTQASSADIFQVGVFVGLMVALATIILLNYLGFSVVGWRPAEVERLPALSRDLPPRREEIVRLVLQTPDVVIKGRVATIEIFVENLATEPFTGVVEVFQPDWPGSSEWLRRRVAVGPTKTQTFIWKLNVPETVISGRYVLRGSVTGTAFTKRGEVFRDAIIEVK